MRLAAEGADVIVVDVCAPLPSVPYDPATPGDLAETVKEVEKLDRRTVSGIVDVRDPDKLKTIVDDGVAQLGRLDVICVNSVHPTAVATPMGSGGMQQELSAAMAGDQRLGAMFMNMMPVDTTQPEDVAGTVLFLASDESTYITARELAPDAGVAEI